MRSELLLYRERAETNVVKFIERMGSFNVMAEELDKLVGGK